MVARVNVEQRILSAAGHLVGASLTGASVLRRGGRNLVLQAGSRNTGGPGEVVVKAATGPENLLPNERAALRFLGSDATTGSFVPRLLGSNPDASILVTGHVAGETLETILSSTDADAAHRAVTAIARTLGVLHAVTRSRHDEWRGQAGARQTTPAAEGESFRELAPAIVRFLERANLRVPDGFREELGQVAGVLEQPGEWFAFTVGDLAPSNVILCAAGPVFVDLEYAGFRHAGYDAAFWHAICPFPESVAIAADQAYFAGWRENANGANERAWLEQTAMLAAHRAWWALTWRAPQIWERDFDEVAGVSARRLRRLGLRGFGRVARRAGVLPVLSSAATELDLALGREWPETETPFVLLPAFAP